MPAPAPGSRRPGWASIGGVEVGGGVGSGVLLGVGDGGGGLGVAVGGTVVADAPGTGVTEDDAVGTEDPAGVGAAVGDGCAVRGVAVGPTGAAGAVLEPEDIRSAGPVGLPEPPIGPRNAGSVGVMCSVVRPPGWSATTPPRAQMPAHATATTWSALARLGVVPPLRNPCMP